MPKVIKVDKFPEAKEGPKTIKVEKFPEQERSLGAQAFDLLNIFDLVGAPVRRGIVEAQEGERTGLGNIPEFGRGVKKHIDRSFEIGPIEAIKEAPSLGILGDMATDPTSWTGVSGSVKAVGKGLAKGGLKKAGQKVMKAGEGVQSTLGKISDIAKRPMKWHGEEAVTKRLTRMTPKAMPESKDIPAISKMVYSEKDLLKFINNPKKLKIFLRGAKGGLKEFKDFTRKGKSYYQTVAKKGGLIEVRLNELDEFVAPFGDAVSDVPPGQMKEYLFNNIKEKLTDAPSGVQLDLPSDKKLNALINKVVTKKEKLDVSPEIYLKSEQIKGIGNVPPPVPGPPPIPKKTKIEDFLADIGDETEIAGYSLKDLVAMKRKISRVFTSRDFAPDKNTAQYVELLKATTASIDDLIKATIEDGVLSQAKTLRLDKQAAQKARQMVESYRAKNREITNLIKLSAIIDSPAYKAQANPGVLDLIMGGFAGAGTMAGLGAVAGVGGTAAIVGGGLGAYAASSGAVRRTVEALPGMRARIGKGIENTMNLDRGLPIMSKLLPDQEPPASPEIPYRSPQTEVQSMIIDSLNKGKVKSLPDQLVETRLPRNSDEVLQNTDFMLMKVAQEAPMAFDMVKNTIENDPEGFKEIFPLLIQMAPHLFARDKYNRIDNKIQNPEDQLRARKDTLKNDNMGLAEKMQIINHLNKTGEFLGE